MPSNRTPYRIIFLGLALFAAGMAVDLAEHGMDFLIGEFQMSPLAHALPAAGILIVTAGALWGWRQGGKA
jgi:hypothetical protein